MDRFLSAQNGKTSSFMRYIHLCIIGSLLCLSSIVQAQGNSEESIIIHLNKPFYTTGENIWYKLYFPNSFKQHNLALKLALVDGEGQPLNKHFLKTGNQSYVDGYFKVPYEAPSAHYHFVILGTAKLDKTKVKLGEVFIPIYNDLGDTRTNTILAAAPTTLATNLNDLKVDLQLGTDSWGRRDQVAATVAVTDKQGKPVSANLSISIKDVGLLEMATQEASSIHRIPLAAENQAANLAEEIYINGKVEDNQGTPWQSTILAVYSPSEKQFFYTKSNSDGRFALKLPDLQGNRTLQFMDYQRTDLKVTLDDNITLDTPPATSTKSEITQYLAWSQMRKKIYQLYNTLEDPISRLAPAINTLALESDQRFAMKDYEKFDDLSIFFNEIVTPFKLRERGKRGYVARMFNPAQQIRTFYKGSPLFIVDGLLSRDANFIYNIPIEKIDTIDLFFESQQLKAEFGPIGNSGIVELKTSLAEVDLPAEDAANIFPIRGLQYAIEEAQTVERISTQPHIGPQLFWAASAQTDDKGTFPFSFTQSDDLGNFLIEISVQDENGRQSIFTQFYTVNQ